MSLVSIIIPIFNAGRFLSETLNSLEAQTVHDWECILVNDGSTDDSINICQEYSEKDKRFSLYSIFNSGCADIPIGFGMNIADSEFCLFMGHDDCLEPCFLEKLLNRQKETDADIVGSLMHGCINELEGKLYQIPDVDFDLQRIMTGREAFVLCVGGWRMSANGMLYRTALNDGVIRGHYMNSDEFSSRQIIYKANTVAFCDALYIYRNHSDSISKKVSPRLWERMFIDQQIEEFTLSHYPDSDQTCRKAVEARFFNFIHLTADAYLETLSMECKARKRILKGLEFAYGEIDKEKLGQYLPKHKRLFMHGFGWLSFASVLYQLSRIVRRKRFYDYK